MKLKYNIEADKDLLPLAIKQIMFFSRLEKKLNQVRKKDHADILVEDTQRWLDILEENEKQSQLI
jgi:hypothetical protein